MRTLSKPARRSSVFGGFLFAAQRCVLANRNNVFRNFPSMEFFSWSVDFFDQPSICDLLGCPFRPLVSRHPVFFRHNRLSLQRLLGLSPKTCQFARLTSQSTGPPASCACLRPVIFHVGRLEHEAHFSRTCLSYRWLFPARPVFSNCRWQSAAIRRASCWRPRSSRCLHLWPKPAVFPRCCRGCHKSGRQILALRPILTALVGELCCPHPASRWVRSTRSQLVARLETHYRSSYSQRFSAVHGQPRQEGVL